MSSVYAPEPRRGAVPSFLSRKPGEKPEKLRLVGNAEPSTQEPELLRRAVELARLGGSPLALYLATAAVVAATGVWVVSDISRRHQPLERPRVEAAALAPAPVLDASGLALTPPARLGDGVVAPAEPATANPAETLNTMMREAQTPADPSAGSLSGASETPAEASAIAASQPPAPVAPPIMATPRMEAAPAPAAALAAPDMAAPSAAAPATPSNVMVEATPMQSVETEMQRAEIPALSEEPAAKPEAQSSTNASAAAATAKCLLKVDGKVLFQRSCSVERAGGRATLAMGDKALTIALVRGETWQATLGGKSLGSVYQTGGCWGRKKQVYICAE